MIIKIQWSVLINVINPRMEIKIPANFEILAIAAVVRCFLIYPAR
jgi:hypothetical protein